MSFNISQYANTTLYANLTSGTFNRNRCTLSTCPLSLAQIHYDPSLAANVIFLLIFLLLLGVNLFLGIRYRTWGFLGSLIGGTLLEIIGYAARTQMHFNPFRSNPFLIYIICLTIAPVFFTAAVYLSLSRIIVVYGQQYARLAPRTYTIIFICCDVFSLVLQATGGGIADTSSNQSGGQSGINIMIAGLSFQVVSLTLFAAMCGDFALRVRKHQDFRGSLNVSCSDARFHGFLWAVGLATLAIYIRSCFRVAELQGGFNGTLANQEVPFIILEGCMVSIATIALTVAHPGLIFGKGWKAANLKNGGNEGVKLEEGHGRRLP